MTRNYKTTWTADQTILAYVNEVMLAPEDSSRTTYGRRYAVAALEQFLGRPALLRDLNDKTLTMCFERLPKLGRTERATKEIQYILLRIGRHAAEREIIDWPMPAWETRVVEVPTTADPERLGVVRYFEEVFLDDRGAELTKNTINTYRCAMGAYERFRVGACISQVTPRTVKRFRQWLLDRGMAKKPAGNRAFAVAAVAKHAHPTKFRDSRPTLRESVDGSRSLSEVMEKLYLPERQTITQPGTRHQYRMAIDSFGRHLGHIATLNDLTDAKVGSFMRALRARGLAILTVNGYRTKLVALWNWCARKRLTDDFPTIQEIPEPKELPVAWTEEELCQLLKGCAAMPGTVVDIPSPLWWTALHLVAWDTGERTGALLALRWDMLDREGRQLVVPAAFRKGRRKPMMYVLKRETIRSIDKIRLPERELIFDWGIDYSLFYTRYKRLLKLSGLPYVKHKSALQKMRRSFATHIEAAGGDATEALAHTTRSLTVNSYIDPRMIERTPANELLFPLKAATGGAA